MIVNTASKWTNTSVQGFRSNYKEYKDKGFVIVGFPANNFASQEREQMRKALCQLNYGVTFPMMDKVSVKEMICVISPP
jgi:glutathione peroxidase